jgi:hypothetical protein
MRRIVIEEVEPCHHGKMYSHRWAWSGWCPGSTTLARTVLTEPSEEMVERAAREWAALWGLSYDAYDSSYQEGFNKKALRILTAALFSSDAVAGEREET